MNSAELFVLAVSLYGHDWGMAVNDLEKEFILTGNATKDKSEPWILPDEEQRFTKFLKNQGISLGKGEKDISIELWREYIRRTHAYRSGERARKYFEHIDGGIADAVSRVCEGHWLDFEDLEDYHQYPPDFSVLRESVNLRALAVYLRLIDLLDLSEDRTPYVIWKFVAPRDSRSKMEWAKHRALRSITCPSYQQGRIIQVDGSTDDHEVYAALEDLRIWAEDQLRGCNDILARMNDPRHNLDLYHIDWRVAARGFQPVLIQFDFDRERMFEILGDDIYQGDSYVFLRELLQNSIDAIRVRREVLRRNRIEPGEIGVIRVNVEHSENGDATIIWTDDGIGMDEYIIRNYFSVAGKSYYRSSDFEREGLNIDPISRFGVGFLSCFMVADRVEVTTFKEPYMHPPSDPLKIAIPAARRQFRVETLSRESAEVGTTIRVFVEGKKLPREPETNLPHPLNVTLYLSEIAGLVEFPIVIEEKNQKTIIISPHTDKNSVLERFGKDFEVGQLDFAYPWSEAILPQDLQNAREYLEEVSYQLSSDLQLEEYEGAISYLIPKNKTDKIISSHNGMQINDIEIRPTNKFSKRFGYSDIFEPIKSKLVSRSANHSITFSVYKDGILVPGASSPDYKVNGYEASVPRIITNLTRNKPTKLNLARTEITDDKTEHWSIKIIRAHNLYIMRNAIADLLAENPDKRLYNLGHLFTFHLSNPDYLWEIFPHEKIPVPFFEKGGHLNILEWGSLVNQPVYKLVSDSDFSYERFDLSREFATLLSVVREDGSSQHYDGLLQKWIGDATTSSTTRGFANYGYHADLTLDGARIISEYALGKSHALEGIRFLRPPEKESFPLVQELHIPVEYPEKLPDTELVLQKAASDPDHLDLIEWSVIYDIYGLKQKGFYKFSPPFQKHFAFGKRFINLNHPLGKSLFQLECLVRLENTEGSISPAEIGLIKDALNKTNFGAYTSQVRVDKDSYKSLCVQFEKLCQSVEKNKALAETVHNIRNFIPKIEEFIPGTYVTKRTSKRNYNMIKRQANLDDVQEFGDVLQ